MVPTEDQLLRAFNDTQRRRQRIGAFIGAVCICGYIGARLYQSHLREESQKPLDLTPKQLSIPHARL